MRLRGFFDEEVAELGRALGRYILINTNFGLLYHFFPEFSTPIAGEQADGVRLNTDSDFMAGAAAYRRGIFRSSEKTSSRSPRNVWWSFAGPPLGDRLVISVARCDRRRPLAPSPWRILTLITQ